ncbi:MAG: glycosyltransferase family 9 protein [Candidatus Omnitrophica bacterium]|nr:glycosyltransferase family 9 protein [Candidatus Omnitrophota bacterium]
MKGKILGIKKKAAQLSFVIRGKILKRPVSILVSRYSGLGDVLLSIPAVKAIKKIYPRAVITYDTSREGREILEGCPYIDHLTVNLYKEDRGNFDREVHFKYELFPEMYIVDAYLRYIGALKTADAEARKPEIWLSDADRAFADDFFTANGIKKDDIVIGVHAQARHAQRRWPIGKFREVIRYIVEKRGMKVIEFGVKEHELAGGGLTLAGSSTLKGSAAVLEKCSMLLCNDSLFLHLAVALGVPVVGIFGPVPPEIRLPRDEKFKGCYPQEGCRGCILTEKDYDNFGMVCLRPSPECMEAVTVDMVKSRVEEQIDRMKAK